MLDNHINGRFVLLKEDAKTPSRFHKGDAGYDMFAYEPVTVKPHSVEYVPTGIGVELPEGFSVEIRTRSSNPKRGFYVVTGTVDNGYKGEIKIMCYNFTCSDVEISKGDKIAQLIFQPLFVLGLEPFTNPEYCLPERGNKGFGSTGTK